MKPSVTIALLALILIVLVINSTATPVPVSAIAAHGQLLLTAGSYKITIPMSQWSLTVVDVVRNQTILAGEAVFYGRWTGIYTKAWEGYLFRAGEEQYREGGLVMQNWTLSNNVVSMRVQSQGIFSQNTFRIDLSDFRKREFSINIAIVSDTSLSLNPLYFSFPFVGMSFKTQANEGFYGFGQRWSVNDRKGHYVKCWTEDGAWPFYEYVNDTTTWPVDDATYMPSPWFLSSRGYGFLVNTTYKTDFDLGWWSSYNWYFRTEASSTSVTLFLGNTPAESLEMFTRRRGRTLIPPPYEFGPWKQFSGVVPGLSDYQVAQMMLQKDIPFSAVQGYVHFFPEGAQVGHEKDLALANAQIHAMGLKSMCYFNPYVSTQYKPVFDQLAQKGWFVTDSNKNPYVFQYMLFEAAEIDFTNSDATAWYQQQIANAIETIGFDFFMYDFGEYTPIDSSFHNGGSGWQYHNAYPIIYQQAAFDYLATLDSNPNDPYAPPYIHYVRSGYSDTGKYTWAHWTGDPAADWSVAAGLPAQIFACLTSGLSGVPFVGSDIGGYVCQTRPVGSPLPELLSHASQPPSRWVEFGAFSGIMRDETTGSGCQNRTQIFTTDMVETVWRKYAKIRTQLFPYIYTMAHAAHFTGLPITRHHLLSFPQDHHAISQAHQYMFGDSFLIAPVITPGVEDWLVYLPAGENWIDVTSPLQVDEFDGRVIIGWSPIVQGGTKVRVRALTDEIPWFVRAGTIVPALDPTVWTVNSDLNVTFPGVITRKDRDNILQLWIWPDATRSAHGYSYDNATFSLVGKATDSLFTVRDPHNRVVICQFASHSAPKGVSYTNGQALAEETKWEKLIAVESDATPEAGWAWNGNQRTIWVRLNLALQPTLDSIVVTW